MPWKFSICTSSWRVPVHGAEDQKKVPDAHAHLHAVGVAVAVVLGVCDRDGLRFCGLLGLAHRVFDAMLQRGGGPWLVGWCERGDSNPHGLLRQILSLVRLPIPPLSRGVEGSNFLRRLCPLWTTELYRVPPAGRWLATLHSSLRQKAKSQPDWVGSDENLLPKLGAEEGT